MHLAMAVTITRINQHLSDIAKVVGLLKEESAPDALWQSAVGPLNLTLSLG